MFPFKKKNTKGWVAKDDNQQKEMPKAGKIHNLLIVDESGSMRSIYNAALTGMNETLQSIKNDASENPETQHEVTLVTFDTEHYNEIFRSTPAKEIREITSKDYQPGGCTPLYDAVGRAVNTLRKNVKENENVLVTIITDGMENASCEYTIQDIKALIDELSEQGWLFTYIGANQDALRVGRSMSINATMNYEANDASMTEMWVKERNSRSKFYAKHRESGYASTRMMNNSDFFTDDGEDISKKDDKEKK